MNMKTPGTSYFMLRLALLIAPFGSVDGANAACAPASPLNNVTVTCTGATANQNGTDGYGTNTDTGNSVLLAISVATNTVAAPTIIGSSAVTGRLQEWASRADPSLAGIPICSFHIMIAMLIHRSLTVRTTPGQTESGWRSISASTSNTSRSARAKVIS
jgi:hypothetical protein